MPILELAIPGVAPFVFIALGLHFSGPFLQAAKVCRELFSLCGEDCWKELLKLIVIKSNWTRFESTLRDCCRAVGNEATVGSYYVWLAKCEHLLPLLGGSLEGPSKPIAFTNAIQISLNEKFGPCGAVELLWHTYLLSHLQHNNKYTNSN